MSNELERIKQQNIAIASQIEIAEKNNDFDLSVSLKKQYYSNKLLMIDLISLNDRRFTISARELRDKVNSMKKAIRYETGISVLDDKLHGGFEVGSLIQLAGQSFAGKTTLFLQIIANISKYAKASFFNFEMGDRRIVKRLTNLLKEEQQWDNLLINSDTRNIEELVTEITLMANDGIKFFAVDSRMKIKKNGNEAEYQKIASISSSLSECAIKNDIIILMINQISEEDLKNKRLSFKGSGDQMFDTDMALFILVEEDGSRKLFCTKNRQDEFVFDIKLPNFNRTFECTETDYEDIPKIETSIL